LEGDTANPHVKIVVGEKSSKTKWKSDPVKKSIHPRWMGVNTNLYVGGRGRGPMRRSSTSCKRGWVKRGGRCLLCREKLEKREAKEKEGAGEGQRD
jgi:hypothetical protein